MKRKLLRGVGIAMLAAAVAGGSVACSKKEESGESTTVVIGFMGDLTGENSAIVIPPYNGAKMAVDEYNRTNPKIKIDLKKYDSKAAKDTAKQLAQQAIRDDKIVGLIGPAFSGESSVVAPLLEESKIPSVSPSATNPDLAKNGWKYWHRVVANDGFQSPGAADFLLRAANAKKVYVINDEQDYSVGIADGVAKRLQEKGAFAGRDKIKAGGSDFSTAVNAAIAANPDAVFYGGYYPEGGKLLKQLRDKGFKGKFMSGDGSLDARLAEAAGAQGEGALISCPCAYASAIDTPEAKKFTADYKAAFNTDPAIYSTEGYDAATAFIKALQAGKSTGEEINKVISASDFKGQANQIKFADNGEIAANVVYVYVIKSGKVAMLGKSDTATLPS